MINPVWLNSFCRLVEVGHFTRTADQLHMTQSGVSQHVRKLEEQLGRPLLLRQGKQFTLTDEGARLYHEGRSIIRSLSDLEELVCADSAHEGLVKLISPGSVGLKLYPHLLELQRRHPGLSIDYRFGPNSGVETAIAGFEVHIGFMTRPSSLGEVSSTAVGREALLLVTPAEVEVPSWDALLALGFIDHPDGAHHAALLLGANYPEFQHTEQFRQSGFSNQINLILEPVCLGLGFTVLPAHAVDAFQKPEQIRVHPLVNPVNETLYLCYHRKKPIPNRAKTVIAEAEKWI
ncbi:LysR family transcriptional regulator [Marinobacterium aestuarii]|uniref:LysR family transcriptional regulator n=1 Tax=Marinobacterium aestuarii TaxID=1821621 RepID=A0A1A9F1L7_9GAMM|nr:LysR family transcriptional regulator [Marinobacterium aestuarii]ANG64116.1 LysR family transcriptional regulator [Marinobacterium aestuarii]